jgi:Protein of unknown function (DUF1214)
MSQDVESRVPKTLEAWRFVQQMLGDVTNTVLADAENEDEALDGLRVISRVTALCSELSVEADPELPWFFDMCSPTRLVGGPNPDGTYLLAMIRGDRRYRVTGTRGRFAVVLSTDEPSVDELDGAQWLAIPRDASSLVVREYVGDASTEVPATLRIDALDAAPPRRLTDAEVAEQFTAMAWTIMKLATLHRTIKPELLTQPNVLLTAQAADLGDADTTPDNLYMLGTFALAPDESLVLEFAPPDTRYWNVALENIWHECIEPRRRHSSVTNKGVRPDGDGLIRIAIGARDFGHGHWLDTGGRHRGFVVLRWLDNPDAPDVSVTVRSGGAPR